MSDVSGASAIFTRASMRSRLCVSEISDKSTWKTALQRAFSARNGADLCFHEGGRRGIGVRCFSPDEARLETLHEALVADGLVRPPDLTVE